jgi:hypothetical protein
MTRQYQYPHPYLQRNYIKEGFISILSGAFILSGINLLRLVDKKSKLDEIGKTTGLSCAGGGLIFLGIYCVIYKKM